MLQHSTDHDVGAPRLVGERLADLHTPCLLLDEGRLDANLARMTRRMTAAGVTLRPHLKSAKSIEIARRALLAPHGPATVSTLKEAEMFARAGITDMIYAVGIAPAKLARVQALRRDGVDIAVLADTPEQADAIVAASRSEGAAIPALIEIDCDGLRCGLPSDDTAAIVAIGATLSQGAELRGVLSHCGGSYAHDTVAGLQACAEQERAAATTAAGALRAAGLSCPVVSVGATPTALCGRDFTGITEVRPGVYMFFDLVQSGIGICTLDNIAISVLATVIGCQASRGRLVVDAGWMSLSRDRGTATQAVDQGYGLVCDLNGCPYPDLVVAEANQEHGIVAVRRGGAAAVPDLPVGAKVRILPNHACATAAQHAGYLVVRAGSDRVHGYWPRFTGW
jgi:D-serine deaminase-like pyridoxal phosphate-dependent protein